MSDFLIDNAGKIAIALSIVFVGLLVTIGLLMSADNNEMKEQNCVQTQEMRVQSKINVGFSTDGSAIFSDGQKIEFKYTCDDHPRWR